MRTRDSSTQGCILLLVTVLVSIGWACGSESPAAPSPDPSSGPAVPAAPVRYQLSGLVTDIASGEHIPDATVTLKLSSGPLTTRTNSSGEYHFAFDALTQTLATTPSLIFVTSKTPHWTNLQLISWTGVDMTKNLRLRPVRTIAAGESMTLSIEPDSSLAWDEEWDPWVFPSLNTQWEEFRVSSPVGGILTVDVRAETGGPAPTVNCPYEGCPWPPARGTVSFPVRPESTLYLNIAISRADVPQRYEISTSLR